MQYVDSLRPSRGTIFRTYSEHRGNDTAVTWAPDGEHIAIGNSQNGMVHVCHLNGELKHTYNGKGGWVYAVAWSPNGKRLACGTTISGIHVWSATTGKTISDCSIRSLQKQARFSRHQNSPVVWFKNSRYVASGAEAARINIWNATTGKVILSYSGHNNLNEEVSQKLLSAHIPLDSMPVVYALALSPDEKRMASASDNQVRVWDVKTGATLAIYSGHTRLVKALSWSPDSVYLASGSEDMLIHLWNPSTGESNTCYTGHSQAVSALAWSPDGIYLASASDDETIRIWDTTIGETIFIYTRHTSWINDLAWSPDGHAIASASGNGTHVWNVMTGDIISLHGTPDRIIAATMAPEGTYIASGIDQNIHVWNTSTCQRVCTYRNQTREGALHLAWSPTGQHIASGNASGKIEVRMVDAGFVGAKVCTYQEHDDIVRAIIWSPDGKRAASASVQEIHVWDATTGYQLYRYHGHSSWTTSLAWSPNGQYIASGACDKTVHVWEATTGSLLSVHAGHTNEVWAVAWSPDSTMLASAGIDTTVQVWQAATGKMLYLYPGADRSSGGMLKRWRREDDPPETGHSSRVPALAWSPDGQYIASGSWDNTVQVWQALIGNNAYVHHHTYDVTHLMWFPDSERIASTTSIHHPSRREIVIVPALFFEEHKAQLFLRLMASVHDPSAPLWGAERCEDAAAMRQLKCTSLLHESDVESMELCDIERNLPFCETA